MSLKLPLLVAVVVATSACGAAAGLGQPPSSAEAVKVATNVATITPGAAVLAPTPNAVTVTPVGSVSPTEVVPPAPTASAAPPPPPVSTDRVTLTDRDDRSTITVHRGGTILVQLGPATPPYAWSEATSSDPSVLHRDSSTQQNRGERATFAAITPGQVTLSATDDPQCAPTCLPPSRLWSVTVVVVA